MSQDRTCPAPERRDPGAHTIVLADNLAALAELPDGCVHLIYVDPPFNTGHDRRYTRLRTRRDEEGDRSGFGGRRYQSIPLSRETYADIFDDYLAWLEPRVVQARRVLAPNGTLYFHIDAREAHYCKVLLDGIFGRECFLNEIIWAYDYGGRSRRRWPAKHDNILVYVRDPDHYVFNFDDIPRVPYMAPGLVGAEKARRGKLPTDTWWQTIVPTHGRERTGYPTQKPIAIAERIILASSSPGHLVLDFCAGSGTVGEAAYRHGRRFYLVDNNPAAMAVMARRLGCVGDIVWIGWRPQLEPVAPPEHDHGQDGDGHRGRQDV